MAPSVTSRPRRRPRCSPAGPAYSEPGSPASRAPRVALKLRSGEQSAAAGGGKGAWRARWVGVLVWCWWACRWAGMEGASHATMLPVGGCGRGRGRFGGVPAATRPSLCGTGRRCGGVLGSRRHRAGTGTNHELLLGQRKSCWEGSEAAADAEQVGASGPQLVTAPSTEDGPQEAGTHQLARPGLPASPADAELLSHC